MDLCKTVPVVSPMMEMLPMRQMQIYHLLEATDIYTVPWACVINHAMSETHSEWPTIGKMCRKKCRKFSTGVYLKRFELAKEFYAKNTTDTIDTGL